MASQGTVKRSTLESVGVSLSWPNLVSQALKSSRKFSSYLKWSQFDFCFGSGTECEEVGKSDLPFQFVYDCFIRVDVKNALSMT